MWQPRLVETARLKYLGIVDALEADIRRRLIAPGDRLPTQRRVAEALGVDLTTVTRAFNEAHRRGLITAQIGRGTFVRDPDAPVAPGPSPIDFSMNIPPQPADVDFRKLIAQGMTQALSGPQGLTLLHYQPSAGTTEDRAAGCRWLAPRLPGLTPDRVLVAAGAQGALFAISALLMRRGDVMAAGAMTYPGLKSVVAQQGLVLAPVHMDEAGLIPASFEHICQTAAPRALFVTPAIDNPTTATLPPDRRDAIAGIARKYGVALIEDDPYSPLLPDPPLALAAIAPDITWHIATLSKCATPALRIAYVAAPDTQAALHLAEVLRATLLMPPPLMAGLASRWISDGTLARITRAIRAENIARQQIAARILRGTDMAADPHGSHLWLHLPAHWQARDFADHADRAGVSILPASAFATAPAPEQAVRISLGVVPDRDELQDGLEQLAGLVKHPAVMRAVV
ncbi:MAG: PLP-dependent aminotransferase family protein [Paracoccus sp. (in: a-proteobacteria)]|uniref:aminotransferase-like domain-containing protein n=1 Tax=Paracoccus sp. TaxID=267 RepID=UPI0026DFDDBB|nr:PLP-dependent aminotransferase family protein [Paracoccus sp. (in: a-proteobacteria)]MDO5631821.1 PLP-dependent aminotransferase family protein [Paracoccus sp. (in: a-proteobacteria)]